MAPQKAHLRAMMATLCVALPGRLELLSRRRWSESSTGLVIRGTGLDEDSRQ